MPPHPSHNDAIQSLATAIDRVGLRNPVALFLDILKPLEFMSSQIAQFSRPFVYGSRWEHYAVALTEEASWEYLRRALSEQSEQDRGV